MEEFEQALASARLEITKYNPEKSRSVFTNHGPMTVDKFRSSMRDAIGPQASKFPKIVEALYNDLAIKTILDEYSKEKGIFAGSKSRESSEIPEAVKNLTLNLDLSRDDEGKFFTTTTEEVRSKVTGRNYMGLMGIKEADAYDGVARSVYPEYLPRKGPGVFKIKVGNEVRDVFNDYRPPHWKKYKGWNKLSDNLPILFKKLIHHLFPAQIEREYFYAWLYESMFKRSFVYLVLCGKPGTGKNRLKLVMRALHGHDNSADGKRSTLREKFNSQLSGSTLAWFDELHYDRDMMNVMKELQNDSISIEKKGVDATKTTRIHSSFVISNNQDRDNYITFDSRKFVPLKIRDLRLEKGGMTEAEIGELTKKVEKEDSQDFDLQFIAQIAKWIKKHGPGYSAKWKNLEYQGPMFWHLANTSMTQWQKAAIVSIMQSNIYFTNAYDKKTNSFTWSEFVKKVNKKGDNNRNIVWPANPTIRDFFEMFRDIKGKKCFKTSKVLGIKGEVESDFYIHPLHPPPEINESTFSLAEQRARKANGQEQEQLDL